MSQPTWSARNPSRGAEQSDGYGDAEAYGRKAAVTESGATVPDAAPECPRVQGVERARRASTDQTDDPVAAPEPPRTPLWRSGLALVVLVGALSVGLMGFSVLRGVLAPPAVPTTASSTASLGDYCVRVAGTEVYSPPVLDYMILFGTSPSELSTRLLGVINAYRAIRADARSDEVAGQLDDMIQLLTKWKGSADSPNLAKAQSQYRSDRDQYAAAYADYKASSQVICPV